MSREAPKFISHEKIVIVLGTEIDLNYRMSDDVGAFRY